MTRVLGQIVSVLMRSPQHNHYFLADLRPDEWRSGRYPLADRACLRRPHSAGGGQGSVSRPGRRQVGKAGARRYCLAGERKFPIECDC